MAKRTKSKAQRGLVAMRIVYASHHRPRDRNRELKVDVRRGTVIDNDHARGLVAVHALLPLDEIRIIKVEAW